MLTGDHVRRVAIVGGVRIPFARSMGVYAEAKRMNVAQASVRVQDATPTYRSYLIGTIDGSPDLYVWMAPSPESAAKSVWVVDSQDSIGRGYVPLINGSDTNFSHPYVLHYPGNGHPTDTPRPRLNTWNLQKYSECIKKANGDTSKMQKCADLLTP